jgi:hypothetical protein
MERGSTKHGPHLDEEMAREVRSQTQGTPSGTRTQEWHEAEPAGEDQPPVTLLPHGTRSGNGGPSPEEIVARSELGRWIPRSALPADREALLRAVTGTAPDMVVDQLAALPQGETFETIFAVWEALGHPNESRP